MLPMAFMLVATITSLCITIKGKFGMIGAGTAAWGDWFQLIFASAMVILAVILVIEGCQSLFGKKKAESK